MLANGVAATLLYQRSHDYFFEGYRAKLLSITATTAALLDGDLLKTIHDRKDEDSAAYQQLRATLRRARDANRRKDTQVKRMFTVMQAEEDRSVLRISVDAEESIRDAAH